ncbi:MAG: FtsQ-type POTRA domain-containing protein [Acidimicrobiia bacterium]|nr:FtsQ-type POTRA domain-containing protein [Acidimicrobiia bacterium]
MIDPRMADRRRTVLEKGARRGIRRAVWLLVFVSLIAGVLWVLQSPMFSVGEIEVTGSDRQDVSDVIRASGFEEGTPLILVNPRDLEDGLEGLPWVRSAAVRRVFPDRVEIDIDQRVAVAWLWASGTYAVLDDEAVVLEYAAVVQAGFPVLQLSVQRLEPGEAHTDPTVLGALEFAAANNGDISGLILREEAGELWATVAGHEVRLGRSVEMPAKAAALAAVLSEGLPEGSMINLIAPTRPAVIPLTPSS